MVHLGEQFSLFIRLIRVEFAAMNTNLYYNPSDPQADTKPNWRYEPHPEHVPAPERRRRRRFRFLKFLFSILLLLAAYFLLPGRQTILILGIDRAFEGTSIGRSDTNILLAINPLTGKANAVSIPRDLWVPIPGYNENRINTAHFFGEGEAPGNGPTLAVTTFEQNFNTDIDHYLRIQLEKFPAVVDALGGVEIQLERQMAGYPAGTHLLNGEQALAFVRSRAGSDDFSRMAQGQIFLIALMQRLMQPDSWFRLPQLVAASAQMIDTDIPLWHQPRLAAALLRASLGGLQFETINREMVTPWVTDLGAQVLLPNWEAILPMVTRQMKP
jgi:LCP family protein required for cell wall assembly